MEAALSIGHGIVGAQLLHHRQAGGCQDPGGWIDAWSGLGDLGIELQAHGMLRKRKRYHAVSSHPRPC